MKDLLDRAWAAGFIDGEGCISLSNCTHPTDSRKHYAALLDVAQVQRAPLDKLVRMFGGTVRLSKQNPHVHYWRLYSVKAARALEAVLPYLVVKQRQAQLALESISLVGGYQGSRRPEWVVARQEAILAEMRILNARQPRHAERLSESAPQMAATPLRMVR